MFEVDLVGSQGTPAISGTLPTQQESLLQSFEFADEQSVAKVWCSIDKLLLTQSDLSPQQLFPLNDLATQISAMDQAEYVKFMAVSEHQELLAPSTNPSHYHERINQMCEIANNLEAYHFEPTITTASDYARELLTEAGQEHLIPHMNLKSYGEQKLTEIGGMAGSYEIVSTLPLELSHSEQQECTQGFTQTM